MDSFSKIVWVYEKDHTTHPFITLGAKTLLEQGHHVVVLDRASEPADVPYEHVRWKATMRKLRYIIKLPGIWIIDKFRIWALYRLRFLWFVRTTQQVHPDVVIASHPYSMLAGWIAARLSGARFVYYSFELYGEQPSGYKQQWKNVERLLIRYGIDALITQNEKRAEYYEQKLRSRVRPVVVHNYKPRLFDVPGPTAKLHQHAGIPSNNRIVLYEGMLQKGRWLDKLLQAAPLLPEDTHLVLLGKDQPGWDDVSRDLLANSEIAGKVSIAPWVPHEELLQYVVDADVGIIIYDDSVLNNYYCEPGKLSDYLNAGIPVVAPDFPTIGGVIRENNIGIVFGDSGPESIADSINQVLTVSRESWRESIDGALKKIQWETQAPAFLAAVLGKG